MKGLAFTNLDQWHEIHRLRTAPPPGEPDPLYAWIHSQHIPTRYDTQVASAFERVIRQHTGTNECWLAINGPSHLGKTTAITQALLARSLDSRVEWRTRTKSGHLATPLVYVEAASNQEARGLLAAVARACGVPDSGNEKDLHRRLGHMLPALGVRLVVVDDAQMYRRSSGNASRLTDGLRHILHLPAAFVFVGIELERSALLWDPGRNNDTVHQLQRRHIHERLEALRPGQEAEIFNLVRAFSARMRAVEGLRLGCLADQRLIGKLATSLQGRPGSILNALKRATVEAIAENERVLTVDHVQAEAAAVAAESALDPSRT